MSKSNLQNKAKIISKEFDALAAHYESNRLAPWYKAHSDEILDLCQELSFKTVLDVGCATAYLQRQLCNTLPSCKAIGLDLSGEMITTAQSLVKSKNLENISFIHADWESLDRQEFGRLKAMNIDLIVCANTLHYFAEPSLACKKFYELLADGGTLIILERDKSSSLLTSLWGLLHKYLIKDQVEFYSQRELSQLLEKAGFNSVSLTQSIRRYFWKCKLFTSIALFNCKK